MTLRKMNDNKSGGGELQVEIRGMKASNIRDAVALIEFADILEVGMANGEEWDELKAAAKLKKLRQQQPLNKGLSFPSISAYGPNGAVIHYKPNNQTNTKIGRDAFFLLDSGVFFLRHAIMLIPIGGQYKQCSRNERRF